MGVSCSIPRTQNRDHQVPIKDVPQYNAEDPLAEVKEELIKDVLGCMFPSWPISLDKRIYTYCRTVDKASTHLDSEERWNRMKHDMVSLCREDVVQRLSELPALNWHSCAVRFRKSFFRNLKAFQYYVSESVGISNQLKEKLAAAAASSIERCLVSVLKLYQLSENLLWFSTNVAFSLTTPEGRKILAYSLYEYYQLEKSADAIDNPPFALDFPRVSSQGGELHGVDHCRARGETYCTSQLPITVFETGNFFDNYDWSGSYELMRVRKLVQEYVDSGRIETDLSHSDVLDWASLGFEFKGLVFSLANDSHYWESFKYELNSVKYGNWLYETVGSGSDKLHQVGCGLYAIEGCGLRILISPLLPLSKHQFLNASSPIPIPLPDSLSFPRRPLGSSNVVQTEDSGSSMHAASHVSSGASTESSGSTSLKSKASQLKLKTYFILNRQGLLSQYSPRFVAPTAQLAFNCFLYHRMRHGLPLHCSAGIDVDLLNKGHYGEGGALDYNVLMRYGWSATQLCFSDKNTHKTPVSPKTRSQLSKKCESVGADFLTAPRYGLVFAGSLIAKGNHRFRPDVISFQPSFLVPSGSEIIDECSELLGCDSSDILPFIPLEEQTTEDYSKLSPQWQISFMGYKVAVWTIATAESKLVTSPYPKAAMHRLDTIDRSCCRDFSDFGKPPPTAIEKSHENRASTHRLSLGRAAATSLPWGNGNFVIVCAPKSLVLRQENFYPLRLNLPQGVHYATSPRQISQPVSSKDEMNCNVDRLQSLLTHFLSTAVCLDDCGHMRSVIHSYGLNIGYATWGIWVRIYTTNIFGSSSSAASRFDSKYHLQFLHRLKLLKELVACDIVATAVKRFTRMYSRYTDRAKQKEYQNESNLYLAIWLAMLTASQWLPIEIHMFHDLFDSLLSTTASVPNTLSNAVSYHLAITQAPSFIRFISTAPPDQWMPSCLSERDRRYKRLSSKKKRPNPELTTRMSRLGSGPQGTFLGRSCDSENIEAFLGTRSEVCRFSSKLLLRAAQDVFASHGWGDSIYDVSLMVQSANFRLWRGTVSLQTVWKISLTLLRLLDVTRQIVSRSRLGLSEQISGKQTAIKRNYTTAPFWTKGADINPLSLDTSMLLRYVLPSKHHCLIAQFQRLCLLAPSSVVSPGTRDSRDIRLAGSSDLVYFLLSSFFSCARLNKGPTGDADKVSSDNSNHGTVNTCTSISDIGHKSYNARKYLTTDGQLVSNNFDAKLSVIHYLENLTDRYSLQGLTDFTGLLIGRKILMWTCLIVSQIQGYVSIPEDEKAVALRSIEDFLSKLDSVPLEYTIGALLLRTHLVLYDAAFQPKVPNSEALELRNFSSLQSSDSGSATNVDSIVRSLLEQALILIETHNGDPQNCGTVGTAIGAYISWLLVLVNYIDCSSSGVLKFLNKYRAHRQWCFPLLPVLIDYPDPPSNHKLENGCAVICYCISRHPRLVDWMQVAHPILFMSSSPKYVDKSSKHDEENDHKRKMRSQSNMNYFSCNTEQLRTQQSLKIDDAKRQNSGAGLRKLLGMRSWDASDSAIANTPSSLRDLSAGRVYSCGSNSRGQLGLGNPVCRPHRKDIQCKLCRSLPYQVSDSKLALYEMADLTCCTSLNRVIEFKDVYICDISCGSSHSVAVDALGSIYIWGADCGTFNDASLAMNNNSVLNAAVLSTPKPTWDMYHILSSLNNTDDEAVVSPTLLPAQSDLVTPVQIPIEVEVFSQIRLASDAGIHTTYSMPLIRMSIQISQVACGEGFTLALCSTRSVIYSWGQNQYGNLGHGHYEYVEKPTPILGPHVLHPNIKQCGEVSNTRRASGSFNSIQESILSIHSGRHHCCCILDNNSMWVWGRGDNGQIGLPLSFLDMAAEASRTLLNNTSQVYNRWEQSHRMRYKKYHATLATNDDTPSYCCRDCRQPARNSGEALKDTLVPMVVPCVCGCHTFVPITLYSDIKMLEMYFSEVKQLVGAPVIRSTTRWIDKPANHTASRRILFENYRCVCRPRRLRVLCFENLEETKDCLHNRLFMWHEFENEEISLLVARYRFANAATRRNKKVAWSAPCTVTVVDEVVTMMSRIRDNFAITAPNDVHNPVLNDKSDDRYGSDSIAEEVAFLTAGLGAFHTLAIDITNTLFSWGNNRSGELLVKPSNKHAIEPGKLHGGSNIQTVHGNIFVEQIETDDVICSTPCNLTREPFGNNRLGRVHAGNTISFAIDCLDQLWIWGAGNWTPQLYGRQVICCDTSKWDNEDTKDSAIISTKDDEIYSFEIPKNLSIESGVSRLTGKSQWTNVDCDNGIHVLTVSCGSGHFLVLTGIDRILHPNES